MAAHGIIAAAVQASAFASKAANSRRLGRGGSASRAAPAYYRSHLRLSPSVPRRGGRWLPPRTTVSAVGSEAESSSTLPSELCEQAKEFTETGSGYFTPLREELFADDFVFRGPVIGPLNKPDYFKTMTTLKVYEAFPDFKANAWGYCVDPTDPNLVRFFVRQQGTNSGPFTIPGLPTFAPTGKVATCGPEAYSLMFNDEGKVKLLTVGYPVDYDAPNVGCNKFGGAIGLTAAVGISLPTGPLFTAFNQISNTLQELGVFETPAKNCSKWEEVPQWYKDYVGVRRQGSEGAPGY